MGRQVNFYMDKDLEINFIEFIFGKGYLLLYTDLEKKKFELVDTIQNFLETKEHYSLYVYHEKFGELIFTDYCSYVIDSTSSPVIQLRRTVINEEENMVFRGRIWYETKYCNLNNELTEKSVELTKCYNQLAMWLKKRIPYRVLYEGKHTIKYYITDKIWELKEFGYSLGV